MIISAVALVAYIIFLFLGPQAIEYPLIDQSKEGLFTELQRATDELGFPNMQEKDAFYIDAVANSSLGRYIEANDLTEEELTRLEEEVPLYTFETDAIFYRYELDIRNGKLAGAMDIVLDMEAEQFITNYFDVDFQFLEESTNEDAFSDWERKTTYIAPTSFPDIDQIVDIYYSGDMITGFSYYGLAKDYPLITESTGEGFASIFILLFLATLVLFVTIHLIIKLVQRRIEAFWAPLFLTIIAGFGWVFVSKAMGSNMTGIGLLDPAIMTYLTFVTLLIRWRQNKAPLSVKIAAQQPAVFQGILLMFIAVILAETFFFGAQFFDTWVSPVTSHIVFVNLDIRLLPVFTVFIGLSAAITEEAIFRNYLIPLFQKASAFTAVVMTSVLWGVMHIGYDMYPWYLYVLEFIVLTGPFFYFVYTKYGYATSVWMHYFYNAWVTTLLLFTVDIKTAFVSLFVMLSPFLVFLVRSNKDISRLDTQNN